MLQRFVKDGSILDGVLAQTSLLQLRDVITGIRPNVLKKTSLCQEFKADGLEENYSAGFHLGFFVWGGRLCAKINCMCSMQSF